MKMSFESGQASGPEKTSESRLEAHTKFKRWSDHFAKMLKVQMAALVIASPLVTKSALADTNQFAPQLEVSELEKQKVADFNAHHSDSASLKAARFFSPESDRPAKRVLYFPQIHAVTNEVLEDRTSEEKIKDLNQTIESQKAIYKSLKVAIKTHELKKVCVEDLVENNDVDDLIETLRNHLSLYTALLVAPYFEQGHELHDAFVRFKSIYADGKITNAEQEELTTEIEPLFDTYMAEYKYIVGGAWLLALENKIELCAAQSQKVYNNNWNNEKIRELKKIRPTQMSDEQFSYFKKVLFEDREDSALELVSKQGESVVALVYGAAHEFEDNLKKWNHDGDSPMELIRFNTEK